MVPWELPFKSIGDDYNIMVKSKHVQCLPREQLASCTAFKAVLQIKILLPNSLT